MSRIRRAIFVAASMALVLLSTTLVGNASAEILHCGQVIHFSTVLSNDVGPCSGPGLIVFGPTNLILDLNHHRVFGTSAEGEGAGILVQNTSGATIMNGTVEQFDAGVVIDGGSGNRVTKMVARDNGAFQIDTELGDGIVIFSSSGNRIDQNTVQRNGPYSGISIVAHTDTTTECGGQFPGTAALTGATPTYNQVIGNTVQDNGIDFSAPPGLGLDGQGIRIEGPGAEHNNVAQNLVTGNGIEGIGVLSVFNGFAPPFGCGFLNPPNPTNRFNLVTGNTARANLATGIRILAFANSVNPTNNTLQNNLSELNQYSGIAISNGALSNSVLYNTAKHNNQAQLPPNPPTVNSAFGDIYDLRDGNNTVTNVPVTANTAIGSTTITATGGSTFTSNMLHGRITGPGIPANTRISAVTSPTTATLTSAATANGSGVTLSVQSVGGFCDNNTWFGNKYITAFPACTTVGGTQLPPNAAAVQGAQEQAATSASSAPDVGVQRPVHGRAVTGSSR